MKRWQGLVKEFKEYLPVNQSTPAFPTGIAKMSGA